MTRIPRKKQLALAAMMVAPLLGSSLKAADLAATYPRRTVDKARVERLLSQMTLTDKLALIHGAIEPPATSQGEVGYLAGVPRLGIPSLRLADGPPGVRTRESSAALPTTLALAATFSVADAQAIGLVVGRNARARGVDLVLEPFINLYRNPGFDRIANAYGEDPLLTGAVGAAFITAVQSQDVMAMAKHFIGYDGGNDVTIGAQALHELYLEPFADAVKAGVASVMCAMIRVNGEFACGNGATLNALLRQELGFTGFVTSDWTATHGAEFINNGLDMEMPGESAGMMAAMNPPIFVLKNNPPAAVPADATPAAAPPVPPASGRAAIIVPNQHGLPGEDYSLMALPHPTQGVEAGQSASLGAALRAGTVKEDTITQAAARVLGQIERFGFLDGSQKHEVSAEPIEQNAAVLRRVSADSAVLLKNDGVLPLSSSELAATAFIGTGAAQTFPVGFLEEKGMGYPEREIGVVEALHRLTKKRYVYRVGQDMAGVAVPSEFLSNDGQPGLVRTDPKGPTVRDQAIDFTLHDGHALPAGDISTWTGTLRVPTAGVYDLNLQILGASGDLFLDDQHMAQTGVLDGNILQAGEDNVVPTPDGLDNVRSRISLTAGDHSIKVVAHADSSGNPVQIRLAWITPQQRASDHAAAVQAAKQAKNAVVFAWARTFSKGMHLPDDQDSLIESIAAVNPNTVVVLNTEGPVAMPWLPQVKAVIEMWYTGDEGGWAAADVLTGKASPAGRLPFTWAQRSTDYVTVDPAHPERSAAGINGKTDFSEGIFIGYRWFDQQQIQPLFPFGFGLSYTSFEYSGLHTAKAADGGLEVSFTLHNSGQRAADEVPQVYLGAPSSPPAGAQFAVRALVGLDRVSLKAGKRKTVKVHVPLRQLQYWDTASARWKRPSSARPIWVGASSRDLRLQGAVMD